MAFVHHGSVATLSPQLDLFAVPKTAFSEQKISFVTYHPISDFRNGPIEFNIPPSPNYTDLKSCRLYLKCRVVKGDGTVIADDSISCSPVNMVFHGMFSKVEVHLGKKLITDVNPTYPWKAGLETLVGHGHGAKSTGLGSIMFYKDMNTDVNTGQAKRIELVKNSKEFEMLGPLQVDMFKQDKYLLNYVPIRIKLSRSTPKFTLITTHADIAPKIEVIEAVIVMKQVHVSPQIEIGHARVLEQSNALYPITEGLIEAAVIPSGMINFSTEGLFGGRIPKKLLIVLLNNTAANGTYAVSPYDFGPHGITTIGLTVDGENVANTPKVADFANDQYVSFYQSLHSVCAHSDGDIDISYSDFKSGHTIFAFDLTLHKVTSSVWNMAKNGVLRIKLSFENALTEPLVMICHGEFDNVIEIDFHREVYKL